MGRKVSIAVLLLVFLLAGLLVGRSYGDSGDITQPVVVTLSTHGCEAPTAECPVYPLRDEYGERSGAILRFNVPSSDIDGNLVGRFHGVFFKAQGAGTIRTTVLTLEAGPHTEDGTVVFTGLFQPSVCCSPNPQAPGFDTYAVTGGTGAYRNVRGQVTLAFDPGRGYVFTFSLIL